MTNYIVNTLNDENDGINNGDVSLRDAINAANASAGADTITFDSSVFNSAAKITLTNGLLFINDNLTIADTGANLLTISGDVNNNNTNDAGDVGLFFVNQGTVNLSGLTFSDGRSQGGNGFDGGGGAAGMGGALFINGGNVTVNNAAFINNQAIGGGGGGFGGNGGVSFGSGFGSNGGSLTIATVTITIADNDTAGVTITQTDASTNISEDGATDTYTVVLNSQPTADVSIAINNGSQTSSNPNSLIFTAANWNVAQTVTLTAVDDAVLEGNHTDTITHTATSNDPNYNNIPIDTITANITENDFNEIPTDLTLSATIVNENVVANTVIGTFTSTDSNTDDIFIYSLVTGNGDTDNNAFTIDGNSLKIKTSPDFETKSSYKIRVKTTDNSGLIYEKALTITVEDVKEIGLTNTINDIFKIQNDGTKAKLQVTLTQNNSNRVNELGVFKVDDDKGTIDGIAPDATGYAQAALQRSKVIFSAITNRPNGFDSELTRLLEFDSDTNLI
ncbi:hypothetical protein IQ277_31610 [Nostocales cyanobacterium LEGE 12452]|nr:hypothetical protein [Nostocales cyanobacterium LEGE 12452]